MKKIIITGGLGYIGFELCKLYSGETRYKNIIVIDDKFFSERVKQLKDWGFKFIQTNINDSIQIKKILNDADIVYHFSGITDVPRTNSESSLEKENEILKVGINGTNTILNSIPNTCKLMFPSTHVIYEGLKETKFNINENEQPCPVLSYSKVKYQNELDIIKSCKNYLILRLASVYGLSNDNTRLNIMPNLFSKLASQNLSLKLFAGGKQYKSLISVKDVARAFKFFAESNISNEIYNLSNENLTVKEVAKICQKYKPTIELLETNDEIPNLGYTLDNSKILKDGFKFLYNIDQSIKEMIQEWSDKNKPDELEYILNSGNDYIDDRGKITNYELSEPINLIGYIESKAGTIRANHYHPIQEQKCLLIKGKYISVVKDLSDENSVIETRLIQEGDIAIIKPNVAHSMVFLEDSIFLNLVRGERDHENYGVTHTIPYKLVDENFKNQLIQGYKKECRSCENKHMQKIISLGKSPLANNLINSENEQFETFPLEMDYCPKCHNCQLNYVVPANKMFDNYLYVSSTSVSFRKHFEDAAKKYIDKFKLNQNSLVVDIGSNDGIALKPFKDFGINVIGVEPASNIAAIANKNGIKTINQYFTENTFKEEKIADIVTASNVFAHADDLKSITKNVFKILKDNGTFIVEVQYLLDTIKDLTFDNIYHEHVNYWSLTSMNNFFNKLGLLITDVEHINTHGGSIRVYIQKNGSISDNVNKFLLNEKEFGLLNYQTYINFSKKVLKTKENIINNLKKIKQTTNTIIGFGSPAKATTALNYYGISNLDIKFIVEDNELKHGKFVPGTKIQILPKSEIKDKSAKVIILAWNFAKEIKQNNIDLINKGIEFISIKELT